MDIFERFDKMLNVGDITFQAGLLDGNQEGGTEIFVGGNVTLDGNIDEVFGSNVTIGLEDYVTYSDVIDAFLYCSLYVAFLILVGVIVVFFKEECFPRKVGFPDMV